MAKQTPTPVKEHHYFRSIGSSLFAIIGLFLLILSIFVFWLNSSLTNTNQFMAIVGPLVTKTEVQDFVATKATSALLENKDAPIRDISQQILGEPATIGKTDDQLRAEITPIIQDNLKLVLGSEAFENLWQTSLRSVHSQLVTQLSSNSSNLVLNLQPIITGAVDQLSSTDLAFIKDKLEIKEEVGVVTISGEQLQSMRDFYNSFKNSVFVLIAIAIVFLTLSVVVAAHRLNTFRRLVIAISAISLSFVIVISLLPNIKIGSVTDINQQEFIVVLFGSITNSLRIVLIVVAIVSALAVLASIFVPKILNKQTAKTTK